jgi:hypothetical protein
MGKQILYYGSSSIIKQPEFGKGKVYNDYGLGFYCTENLELAKEWACMENVCGYANKYEISTDNLKVLYLSSDEYSILNWLAILLQNRVGRLSTPVARRGREYLLDNFLPEYEEYDVIIGYRADDSYFSFAKSFVSNEISLKQLGYAMKLGKLGEQFVLKSENAFRTVKFVECIKVDQNVYYPKRKIRDEEARAAYRRELEKDDMNGVFMRDIIREEMKADDVRLH